MRGGSTTTDDAAMEIEVRIPDFSRGFDAWSYSTRIWEWHKRVRIGAAGIREIKDQIEFESSEGQGNA